MRTRLLLVAAVCFSMFAGSSSALDASGSNTDSAEPAQPVVESTPPTAKGGMSIGSKVGVAVKMSLLGVGRVQRLQLQPRVQQRWRELCRRLELPLLRDSF